MRATWRAVNQRAVDAPRLTYQPGAWSRGLGARMNLIPRLALAETRPELPKDVGGLPIGRRVAWLCRRTADAAPVM